MDQKIKLQNLAIQRKSFHKKKHVFNPFQGEQQ